MSAYLIHPPGFNLDGRGMGVCTRSLWKNAKKKKKHTKTEIDTLPKKRVGSSKNKITLTYTTVT